MSSASINIFIQGTCEEMCPKNEREMRQRERLLHPLEMKIGSERHSPPLADPAKTVKEYSRPAAGHRQERACDLRPLPVLSRTTNYLVNLALNQNSMKSWTAVYDFVADRLRAVRKDLVVQGLGGEEVLSILELMVLFHIYAGYRLCDQQTSKFDPKLNNDLLIDCLRRALDLYDFGCVSKNRDLIESIFALHDIHRGEGQLRLVSLPPDCRTEISKNALRMTILVGQSNYARIFRKFKDLPPPLACTISQHLPHIRRTALALMSVAYSSKVLKVPACWLASLMSVSVEDVFEEATAYGIQHDDSHLHFQKGSFNVNAKVVPCTRLKNSDIELKMENFMRDFLVKE
ncbi:SAC3 domain-containing protein 1 isoform X1 [Neocloeon triangulifer]|uniref:SAC3 domain-containing protein 1 isoform X1 n=1 Tax=Neocloeon triangulifer TaxID=2078957 RepID=UPI00286EF6F6|nr:SAC3 domain-containing protein 1 isoform X1 [Neocloeon triangulifer]